MLKRTQVVPRESSRPVIKRLIVGRELFVVKLAVDDIAEAFGNYTFNSMDAEIQAFRN